MGSLLQWIALLLVGEHLARIQSSIVYQGFTQVSNSNFIPTATATGISQKCIDDSQQTLRALKNNLPWAVSMFRASGSLPHNKLFVNCKSKNRDVSYDPGLYDQCLSIVASSSTGDFHGQYCTVYLSPIHPSNKKASRTSIAERPWDPFIPAIPDLDRVVGFCLPSSCSAEDLRLAVAQALSKNKQSVMVRSHDRDCYTEEKIRSRSAAMDGPSVFLMIVLITVGLLVVSATLFEAFWMSPTESASLPVRVLHCFSAIRNTKELLSTSKPSADDISCLHGMRVLSFVGIILVHTGEEIYRRRTYNRTMMSIFVCVQGYGGAVNDLLSCKVFVPLSRLTYVVFLTHYTFISVYVSESRMPSYCTSISLVVSGCGVLVVAFILSSIIAVAVEMPFRNLEKFILPRAAPKLKKENQVDDAQMK